MSFVVDTDICSAHLKGNGQIYNRFAQYRGGIYISILTLGELYTWASRNPAQSERRVAGIADMLSDVQVLPVDQQVAIRFGVTRADLLGRGIVVDVIDLFIAATALELNYTVVTHNVKHFRDVPGLRIEGWLAP
jgi:tRNA(fMet)-specific endonuclease VapC